jgi:hypothetical protein
MTKLQGGVLMVTLVGLMVSSGTSGISAEDPKRGATVQGNQLKVMPGYVLEKKPNNQMTARPRAGGGSVADLFEYKCGCSTATGTCGIRVSTAGDVATCAKNPDAPCSGRCEWANIVTKMAPPRPR